MNVLVKLLEYIKELVTNPGVIFIGAITVVEFVPIKINPWKTTFAWFGRAINGELIVKMDKLEQEVRDSKQETKDLRNVCDERDATLRRTHILHFNDEILHGIKHTKEHFDQILEDITDYNNYCDEHPKYENDKAVFAIDNIKRTYQKCMDNNSFL